MLAWPSSVWITRRSAPFASRCVAKACRSVCGETAAASSPEKRARVLDQQEEALAGHMPAPAPRREEDRASAAAAARPGRGVEMREPGRERRARRRRQRHHPLAPALAAHQDHPRIAPRRATGSDTSSLTRSPVA